MTQFANQYSFLLVAIPVVLLGLFLLLRGQGARWKQVTSILLLGLLVAGYLYLRPGNNASSASEVQAVLARGDRPMLLEVYSDY